MNSLLVFPMLLPIIVGVLLIFLRTYGRLQAWVSIGAMVITASIAGFLLHQVQTNGMIRLDFGGWEPPFGILFVADSFSVLLVLTASLITAICF